MRRDAGPWYSITRVIYTFVPSPSYRPPSLSTHPCTVHSYGVGEAWAKSCTALCGSTILHCHMPSITAHTEIYKHANSPCISPYHPLLSSVSQVSALSSHPSPPFQTSLLHPFPVTVLSAGSSIYSDQCAAPLPRDSRDVLCPVFTAIRVQQPLFSNF